MPEIRMSSLGVGEKGKVVAYRQILYGTWAASRSYNYTITTDYINTYVAYVEVYFICTATQWGIAVDEQVKVSSPYPIDGGRTAGQGPGITFDKITNSYGTLNVNLGFSEAVSIVDKTGQVRYISPSNFLPVVVVFLIV
jgi:hypothetical protein